MSIEAFKKVDSSLMLSKSPIQDYWVLSSIVCLFNFTNIDLAFQLGINRFESLLNHLETMLWQASPHHIEELVVADLFVTVHIEDVK
jgi:hypothetical protein